MTPALLSAERDTRADRLVDLAIIGLERMYIPERKLFCDRLRLTTSGITQEGISHRYTAMSTLGLLRANEAGLHTPIATTEVVEQLLSDTSWVNNIGDLGLLLWLCAVSSPTHLAQFYSVLPFHNSFDQYRDTTVRRTMELSWFLTGLTIARAVKLTPPAHLDRMASEAYETLRNNQGTRGLFGHMDRLTSAAGLIRGRVGSFADQVYPIIAMVQYARVFGAEDAYVRAEKCARAICQLQGPLGQWWWHYDSKTSRVIEQYPVFSVHQHGMAPMALHAVEDAAPLNFQENINKGVDWVDGDNELHRDMKDFSAGVVWRNISETPLARWSARLRVYRRDSHADRLRVVHECRSYEMGWLLYGLADRR